MMSLAAPALEIREILSHLLFILFACDRLGEAFIDLVHEL